MINPELGSRFLGPMFNHSGQEGQSKSPEPHDHNEYQIPDFLIPWLPSTINKWKNISNTENAHSYDIGPYRVGKWHIGHNPHTHSSIDIVQTGEYFDINRHDLQTYPRVDRSSAQKEQYGPFVINTITRIRFSPSHTPQNKSIEKKIYSVDRPVGHPSKLDSVELSNFKSGLIEFIMFKPSEYFSSEDYPQILIMLQPGQSKYIEDVQIPLMYNAENDRFIGPSGPEVIFDNNLDREKFFQGLKDIFQDQIKPGGIVETFDLLHHDTLTFNGNLK